MSAQATTYYLPTATDHVRLKAGEVEVLAVVLHVSEEQVVFEPGIPGTGEAEIIFSHPRGVMALHGTLGPVPGEESVALTIAGQRQLEQRRGAFRLATSCPVHVTRRSGEVLTSRTGDLSVSGVRILDAVDLADDEVVDLEIELEARGPVKLLGQVVRRDDHSLGVTFRDLPRAVEMELSRFLTDAQRRRLRPD